MDPSKPPAIARGPWSRARRVLVGVAGLGLFALATAHTAPIRGLVLRHLTAAVRTSLGIEMRVSSLSYNLLTLSGEFRDVEVASVDTPDEPFGSADTIGVDFGVRTLLGHVDLQQVSLRSPRIAASQHADGSDNLPEIGGNSNQTGVALPDIHIENLDVVMDFPTTTIAIRDVTATMTTTLSGQLAAKVDAVRGLSVLVDGITYDCDAAAATLTVDGSLLTVRDFTATSPGLSLHVNGTMTFADEMRTDLTLTGSTDLATWPTRGDETALRGHVDVRGRLTGTVADPTASFDANGRALAWSDVEIAAARATGRYQRGMLTLDSYDANLARGTIHGRGTIALDANGGSRVDAGWSNIHFPQLLGTSSRFAHIIAPSGSGTLQWRRTSNAQSPLQLEVDAAIAVVASGRTTPLLLRARSIGERWQVEVMSNKAGPSEFRLGAEVRLNQYLWRASNLDGRVAFRTDARALSERARDFGVPLGDIDPATVAGSLDVTATIGGTLGAVRAVGQLQGRALTVTGAPPAELTASFAVDMGDRTSSGAFSIVTADLSGWQPVAEPALDLRGSASATGSWSGPLTNPLVDVVIAGQNLVAVVGGPTPLTLSAGTFDATLAGPLDALGGRGRLELGAVDLNGRSVGQAALNLTLEGRSLGVAMSVPGLNARASGSVALEKPHAFSADGHVTSVELTRLTSWLAASSESDVRGTLSASFETAGDLAEPSQSITTIVVAPLEATVYGVLLRASSGLRATLEKGETSFDEFQLTLGEIAVRADADFRLHEPVGGLTLAVDGDLASLAPWLHRLNPEQPWSTAGRINGMLAATRTPAGVAVTGSLESTLASVAQGERVFARDARMSIELAESRVIVRELTGLVFGGPVEVSADAPLGWLANGLPDSWQIQSPANDAPATASLRGTFDVATALEELAPGKSTGRGGQIVVAADLSTPRPDLAAVTGNLRFDDAELTSRETTLEQAETTRLRLAEGQLTVESLHWKGPSSELIGRGVIGLAPGTQTNARLEVDSALGEMAEFLEGRATGRLTGTIALDGTSDDWQVTADAKLEDATWLIPNARVLMADWSGQLRIDEDEIAVTDLGGRVNGGTVRINGSLPYATAASATTGITMVASDVLFEVPKGLHSHVNADLAWRPAGAEATLNGSATITANRYSEPVTRVLALVEALSRTTSGPVRALPERLATTRLDVAVMVTDPVIVDNSLSSVELVPNLRVVGSAQSPALDGRIDVVDDGRIRIGGHTYRLRESRLRFAPADGLAPTLDVIGDTRIGEYDVTLRVRGRPDGVETTYRSSPPLSQRDLQSLILTGRVEAAGGDPGSGDNAAGAAATDILGFAGKFVGLDSVRLGAANLDLAAKDVSTDQHLTVSKSFGSRFELLFSDNLETGALTWLIAWRPAAGYEARAASVEDTTYSLDVQRVIVFGPGSATRAIASGTGSNTAPVIVAEVVIDGTPGFSEDELLDTLHLEQGDRFTVREWIEDRLRLERFYRKHGYHRVRIAPSRADGPAKGSERTITLRYEIERGPKTIISAAGDELPSDAVSAMYDEWRGVPVTEVLVGEFEDIARRHLAGRGYYRPQVRVDFLSDTPDLAEAVIKVDRGPQTRQQAIEWSGNTAVSTGELDALVVGRFDPFDPQAVEWDVRQLYSRRGYLQTAVEFREPRFSEDLVTRPIVIKEGRVARIIDVTVDGAAPTRLDAVRTALNLGPGTPFVSTSPAEAVRRIETFYRNLGYRNAKVSHVITPDADGNVKLAVTVDEGAPYQIGAVNVTGVETTNAGLVRDAITLEPGAVASEEAAETTRRNLSDIGSFRDVEVSFVPPATPGATSTDVAIQVEEPKRFQLRYGGLITSDQSVEGVRQPTALGAIVELRDRNFIGRAMQAGVAALYQPDFQTLTAQVLAPRFFGWSVPTSLYARERHEDVPFAAGTLLDRRREVIVSQRKRTNRGLELTWGYDFSYRVFQVKDTAGQVDLGGLLAGPKAAVVIDRRDSPFDARRGWFHSSSVQVGVRSFGSDLGYLRFLTRQSFYQQVGPVILAASGRFGMLEGYSGTAPLTILDLFFLAGGANSVRGYTESALSALSFHELQLGGTELLILNGEVRYPISKWFAGVAFVDAGNTFTSRQEIALRKLAVGVGAGLRVRTPLIPIRFDLGYPMTTGFEQRRLRVHFSVGQMF